MWKTLRLFYKYAAEKKLAFTGFILLVVLANFLAYLSPYFFKLFVDSIPQGNFDVLYRILLLYMGSRLLSLLLDNFGRWLGDYNVVEAALKLRVKIFRQVQDLDFAFHSNKSTGSLISIFKRGDGAFYDIFDSLHHRFLEVLVGIVTVFYFFTKLDPRIAAVAVVSILITLLATKFLIENNVKKRVLFNNEEDKVSGIITDNLLNYETVKLFSKENWELERLNKAFIPWRRAFWGFGNTFRLIDFSIGGIINATVFAILVYSLKSVIALKFDIGDFVLVTTFVTTFFPNLWMLVWGFRSVAKNYADIEKYFGLLDYEIAVKDPGTPITKDHVLGHIQFDSVKFAYGERKKNAINGIDLEINPGESVALVGRSGSGKTTIVKLLMRFYDVTGGRISIDDINIRNFSKSNLRSFMGVVPQEPILFNNTVAYNIGYGKIGANISEIRTAAKIANIDSFIESMPKKYNTEVGERGVKLSGGQKQRLAIARMILSDPDIVIFDEATSHLDSESEKLIQEAFWKARHGKTTIIVAHRLSTIMRADKIVVLDHGRIKEVGTHENLLNNKSSLYSHFWDLQIKLD